MLFVEKKIILDLLPTARHPASGTTRGDVQLKHNTWAESGYTVLVIPDKQWVKAAAEGEEGKSKSKWIKGKVEQLHKQFYIQNAGVQDSEVQTLLMSLKLGKTGINTDALNRLTALPVANQSLGQQKASQRPRVVMFILQVHTNVHQTYQHPSTSAREGPPVADDPVGCAWIDPSIGQPGCLPVWTLVCQLIGEAKRSRRGKIL